MENRHGLQWDHYTLKFTILTNSQHYSDLMEDCFA